MQKKLKISAWPQEDILLTIVALYSWDYVADTGADWAIGNFMHYGDTERIRMLIEVVAWLTSGITTLG